MSQQNDNGATAAPKPNTTKIPDTVIRRAPSNDSSVVHNNTSTGDTTNATSVSDEVFTEKEVITEEQQITDEMLDDAKRLTEGDYVTNIEKQTLVVPLGTADEMDAGYDHVLMKDIRDGGMALANINAGDMTSDQQAFITARRAMTSAFTILKESLEEIDDVSTLVDQIEFEKDNKKVIMKDRNSHLSQLMKEHTVVDLNSAPNADFIANTIAASGVRRVQLWNSGFHVNIKKLTMEQLNDYYNTANRRDYEYGKIFGAFYYLYAGLLIDTYIVEKLFPAAISGSSYTSWTSPDKLLSAISFQDYPVILWALGLTMHPDGVDVRYTCGNNQCNAVEKDKVDLFKLKHIRRDMINDTMLDIMCKKDVTDEDIVQYKEAMNMGKSIVIVRDNKTYKFTMRQISIDMYLKAGREFNQHLERKCNLRDAKAVTDEMIYQMFKIYKPWIKEISITDEDGRVYNITNDGSANADKIIDIFLDEITQTNNDYVMDFNKYIIDTKLTHIAFYKPHCKVCGKPSTGAYKGYIPYDPAHNFFILANMKRLRSMYGGTETT